MLSENVRYRLHLGGEAQRFPFLIALNRPATCEVAESKKRSTPGRGDALEGSSPINHTLRHKVSKIARDAILVRKRQEETGKDSVR